MTHSMPIAGPLFSDHPSHDFPRPAGSPLRVLGGLCAGALLLLVPQPARCAQGRLDAQYEATLAGIPVGKGAWTIDIADDQFSAAASGGTAGLLKAFSGGSGTGASQGRVVNGALVRDAIMPPPPRRRRSPKPSAWCWPTALSRSSRSSRSRRSMPTGFRSPTRIAAAS